MSTRMFLLSVLLVCACHRAAVDPGDGGVSPIAGAGGDVCAALQSTEDCQAHTGCVVAGCVGCTGEVQFSVCYPIGTPPAAACAGGLGSTCPCEGTPEARCVNMPFCHAVFASLSEGATFERCADGGAVRCDADPVCALAAPVCAADQSPARAPEGCYEGCVEQRVCL